MPIFSQLPPLSLYIHFPWCVRKCPYCDFNSHEQKNAIPENDYISTLLTDLENDLPLVWGRKVNSIFMGGGTPSLFSPKAIESLLAGIRARLPLSPTAEITLEANPGTMDSEKFYAYKTAGVNRLSLGIQSFNNDLLKNLGRIHDADAAISAIETAKKAEISKINVDLMFGLPEQDLTQCLHDLAMAIELAPSHISYYQLTIEPNTAFFCKSSSSTK